MIKYKYMNQKLVSYILPIFNTPIPYLKSCFNSLVNQDSVDFEVILVNDGSNEEVKDICIEICKLDQRFILINQLNSGVSVSRNIGIERSKGKWIVFVDPDDIPSTHFTNKILEISDLYPASDILIFNHTESVGKFNKSNWSSHSSNIYNNSLILRSILEFRNLLSTQHEFGSVWGKAYNRKFLETNNLKFPILERAQDRIFNLYAFYYAKNILLNSFNSYFYRVYQTSSSKKANLNTVNLLSSTTVAAEEFILEKKSYFLNNSLNIFSNLNLVFALNQTIFNNSYKGSLFEKYYYIKNSISRSVFKKNLQLLRLNLIDDKVNRFTLFFLKYANFFTILSLLVFRFFVKIIYKR